MRGACERQFSPNDSVPIVDSDTTLNINHDRIGQGDFDRLQPEWNEEMFSYEIPNEDGVVVVTATGKTTVDDYQTTAPAFFEEVQSQKIRLALFDASNSQGMASKNAEALAFMARQMSGSLFDKIALVFHDGIRNDMLEFAELIRNSNTGVRLFSPQQYETAMEWLKADQA